MFFLLSRVRLLGARGLLVNLHTCLRTFRYRSYIYYIPILIITIPRRHVSFSGRRPHCLPDHDSVPARFVFLVGGLIAYQIARFVASGWLYAPAPDDTFLGHALGPTILLSRDHCLGVSLGGTFHFLVGCLIAYRIA